MSTEFVLIERAMYRTLLATCGSEDFRGLYSFIYSHNRETTGFVIGLKVLSNCAIADCAIEDLTLFSHLKVLVILIEELRHILHIAHRESLYLGVIVFIRAAESQNGNGGGARPFRGALFPFRFGI